MSDEEVKVVSWPRRIVAYLIDSLVIAMIKLVYVLFSLLIFEDFSVPETDSLFISGSSSLVFASLFDVMMFLIGAGYWIYFEYRYGQTVGKRFMKAKTVKLNGSGITGVDAMVLAVGKSFPGLLVFDVLIGVVFARGQGQKLSNKITNTCVVSRQEN